MEARPTGLPTLCTSSQCCFDLFLEALVAQGGITVGALADLVQRRPFDLSIEHGAIGFSPLDVGTSLDNVPGNARKAQGARRGMTTSSNKGRNSA